MELIADGVLILAALAAMAYCMVLSRRLRRLTELDGGLGAAITALSREVDHLSGALAEAKTATTDSATDLGAQCRAAHIAARRLETLVKSANKTVFTKPAQAAPAKAHSSRKEDVDDTKPEASEPAMVQPKMAQVAKTRREKAQAKPAAPRDENVLVADPEKAAPDVAVTEKPKKRAKTDEPRVVAPEAEDTESAAPDESVSGEALPVEKLDAAALDKFIGAIIAKGDADDNAALARRLVMALASQEGARSS